jgi:hypothetical protein
MPVAQGSDRWHRPEYASEDPSGGAARTRRRLLERGWENARGVLVYAGDHRHDKPRLRYVQVDAP